MPSRYECPFCHRPLMGPSETCGGSFTEDDHPSAVAAVPVERPWTIQVCADCGEPTKIRHTHKPPLNGIITNSDLLQVEVVPADLLEKEKAERASIEKERDDWSGEAIAQREARSQEAFEAIKDRVTDELDKQVGASAALSVAVALAAASDDRASVMAKRAEAAEKELEKEKAEREKLSDELDEARDARFEEGCDTCEERRIEAEKRAAMAADDRRDYLPAELQDENEETP